MQQRHLLGMTIRAAALGAAAAALLVSSGLPASAAPTPNLLKNGTAEAKPGGTGQTVPVPGWTRTTGKSFTAVKYGSPGFPSNASPAPHNRGKNFFAGGSDKNFNDIVAVQTIPIGKYAQQIDNDAMKFTAAGWFGGKGAERDVALLEIDFKDASGSLIGTSTTVGGVTAANRHNVTGLLHRLKTAYIPVHARSIYVQAIFERVDGNCNDGYMDNVTITLAPAAG